MSEYDLHCLRKNSQHVGYIVRWNFCYYLYHGILYFLSDNCLESITNACILIVFLSSKTSCSFWIFLLQAEIARQEARLKMERENLEKEKSVLTGTASNQDNQDGALEITVSGEKYRCLRFSKAKKWQQAMRNIKFVKHDDYIRLNLLFRTIKAWRPYNICKRFP